MLSADTLRKRLAHVPPRYLRTPRQLAAAALTNWPNTDIEQALTLASPRLAADVKRQLLDGAPVADVLDTIAQGLWRSRTFPTIAIRCGVAQTLRSWATRLLNERAGEVVRLSRVLAGFEQPTA